MQGFDQQMSKLVVEYMKNHGTKFLEGYIPTKIERIETGKLAVSFAPSISSSPYTSDSIQQDHFDTVIAAIGRDPVVKTLDLHKASVELHPKTGKIRVNEHDQTSQPNIFALGDVVHGGLELTPVAIRSAKLLSHRLYGSSSRLMDYANVPTTVFTPLEYSCVGLSEEKAVEKYGQEQIEVYHTFYKPLEWTISGKEDNVCYCKVICNKADHMRLLGIHYLGPNAAEVMQGFALAVKHRLKYCDLEDLVGIHPSTAEELTLLNITKSSGVNPVKTGC